MYTSEVMTSATRVEFTTQVFEVDAPITYQNECRNLIFYDSITPSSDCNTINFNFSSSKAIQSIVV